MSTKEEADITYIVTHARSIIKNLIWPKGPTCPDCGSHHFSKLKDGRYYCKDCGRRYSPKLGTIFQKSHLPLNKWLIALYLMLSNNGISSPKLAKYINVTQPTAYRMLMKLRFLFGQEDTILEGDNVAIDEMYVGGTWSRMKLSKKQELLDRFMLPTNPKTVSEKLAVANKVNSLYKSPVVAINDGERVVLKMMTKCFDHGDMVELFKKYVRTGSHTVSDCSTLYDDWMKDTGCPISQNNHSKAQFKTSDGKSSNPVEGNISQWKRQTLNNHCSIMSRCLQLYLDEFAFRFGTRNLPILERIKTAFRNVRQIVTDSILANYDSLNGVRKDPILFNPYEYFEKYGSLTTQVVVDKVVYRREDFMRR